MEGAERSRQLSSILIRNIGTLLTGDLKEPLSKKNSIYIEDGRFVEIGTNRKDADTIVDAKGLLVSPGLIDGHVHPTIGDFTAAQNATSWVTNYCHCGITRMVSAGEIHYPGLPFDLQDPKLWKGLARLTKLSYDRERPSGVKVDAGTLILTTGLKEADFDEMVELGSKCVKFIFYPYGRKRRRGGAVRSLGQGERTGRKDPFRWRFEVRSERACRSGSDSEIAARCGWPYQRRPHSHVFQ